MGLPNGTFTFRLKTHHNDDLIRPLAMAERSHPNLSSFTKGPQKSAACRACVCVRDACKHVQKPQLSVNSQQQHYKTTCPEQQHYNCRTDVHAVSSLS